MHTHVHTDTQNGALCCVIENVELCFFQLAIATLNCCIKKATLKISGLKHPSLIFTDMCLYLAEPNCWP